ncbi:hypothetical protein K1719_033092 [Acacia pycnantha]|nr:hypothetical protein K1719_033092 [Acacia pycnantha]
MLLMYQVMNYTFFSDVDDSKDTWSVVAKVLRKWVVRRKAAPYAVWKVGMLLADEKGSRVEVSATHKNLIDKLKDQPREGIVYNFQNFQDQRREFDIIKRLNFSILDANENMINITLWGDCAEETYGKKHEDMEPPITVLVRFARLNRNTDYGHLSNAFNATLVTLNPDIPKAALLKERLSQDSVGSQLFGQISNVDYPTYSSESLLTFRTRIPLCDISKLEQECDIVTKVTIQKCETLYGWVYDACPCDKKPEYQPNGSLRCTKCDKDVLMTVPKYKVHYKVYDDTGKCSVIFFDRHATELLGQSASKIKEDMQKEGRNTTIPKELDEIAGKESTASRETVRTESQDNVIEDDDNTLSQLITPPEANT